ncbi:WD repeat-containing protein 47 [Eupeodes corollae]|uniref:WD repeat-containing protein 47 n=1 Tax=Eupeodes corollae TaxID=290404 RepID=UPI0024936ED6|nr:WD repeat-containing protein 47 [Eupeodes corollae]
MQSAKLALREEDVVRLTLEFLDNRELHISQLSLERETGVINGQFSDDVLFLRQLILDGQWDDVVEFIQPLEALSQFNIKKFCYTILRHKYIELLCIKSEAGGSHTAAGQGVNSMEGAVEEVVQLLEQLEKLAPTKEEYSNLCLLLTFPRLADHLQFRDWNPSKARVQCFREIFPLVEKFLPHDSKLNVAPWAKNDRLIQLIIKGVLYESCVSYCQAKATGSTEAFNQDLIFSKLLDGSVGFSDSDLSLLSWLQSIPSEIFSVPFEQKTLNVNVECLERPSLETSWTEHMLVTPIKPKTFPHSVMPFTRPRSAADIMTRSLVSNLEALPFGMNAAKLSDTIEKSAMSRSSFASFHLTGIKSMNRNVMANSVDRLFSNDFTSGNGNANHGGEFESLPSIQEIRDINSSQETQNSDKAQHDRSSGRESPNTATSTAKSSRRDSLSESQTIPAHMKIVKQTTTAAATRAVSPPQQQQPSVPPAATVPADELYNSPKASLNFSTRMKGELFEKFHNQKMKKEEEITSSIMADSHDATSDPMNTSFLNKDSGRPHFVAVTSLEDVQAVRCAEFHPSGRIYAVGSNSKTFRICEYPSLLEVQEQHTTYQPTVLFKRTKHHKGSIYCMGWAPDGELVATGSNDKTIKLMRYNEDSKQLEGGEIELTVHDGTVRDLCFLEDSTNKASLLISGGAGDCKIYVTDCATATPFQALSGHGGHILSLFNWGCAVFASGSHDKTVRFWDLRTRGCVNTITPATNPSSRQGSPVAAVCVDPSGRLLVSGHEDSSCVLYDIRGNRPIQCFKPHAADVRSIRFSPSAYYLLTSGYDNKLVLTDLQADLTLPLPSVVVAQHADKVISGRWHPTDFSFLSTSADKTATLWALPPL